jgi:50S ribosomal subunit-associated GTPase HflX
VVTRIVESISSNTKLETSIGLGTATATSKHTIEKEQNFKTLKTNTAIFKLPYNVVKTLLTTDNSGLSDTSFKIRRQFVATLSSSGTATLTAGTNETI